MDQNETKSTKESITKDKEVVFSKDIIKLPLYLKKKKLRQAKIFFQELVEHSVNIH